MNPHLYHSLLFFFKWANPGLFSFIFVLFRHIFYRKNCGLLQDLNSDRRSRRQACWPLDHHPNLYYCLAPISLPLLSMPLSLTFASILSLSHINYLSFFFPFISSLSLSLNFKICGLSYKGSTIINYIPTIVTDMNIPHITTLEP